MISKSLNLFFLDPLKKLFQGFLYYLIFTFRFVLNVILLKNITNKTADDLLLETFKILKIIIFFIVTNIAFNEIFKDNDSNLLKELIKEGLYLVFFYICFLVFYYICSLYEKITSNSIHKVIVLRYLLLVMLSTIVFFQIDGIMNPNHANHKFYNDLAINNLLVIFILFSVMLIIQSIHLLKKKLIQWFDIFYYIIMTALIFILISINGSVIILIVAK